MTLHYQTNPNVLYYVFKKTQIHEKQFLLSFEPKKEFPGAWTKSPISKQKKINRKND